MRPLRGLRGYRPVLWTNRRILWFIVVLAVAVPAILRGILYITAASTTSSSPSFATIDATHVPLWVYGIVWLTFGAAILAGCLGVGHRHLPTVLWVFAIFLSLWAVLFVVSAVAPPAHAPHVIDQVARPGGPPIHRGYDAAISVAGYAVLVFLLIRSVAISIFDHPTAVS